MHISTDIHGLFILVLAAFTLGSTFLSAYTVLNVVRLRGVRLGWKDGKLFGYPLFATLFLLSVVIVTVLVYSGSFVSYYPVVGCYAWIGLNWFAASFFASKRYITDHGIVKNINDPSQTVAWYQITDFVEKSTGRKNVYIFLYQEQSLDESEANKPVRLELEVPDTKYDQFKKIVSYKLGKAIRTEVESLIDMSTVN